MTWRFHFPLRNYDFKVFQLLQCYSVKSATFFLWKAINYFPNSILIYILEIKLAYVFVNLNQIRCKVFIRTTMYIFSKVRTYIREV